MSTVYYSESFLHAFNYPPLYVFSFWKTKKNGNLDMIPKFLLGSTDNILI